MSDNNPHGWKRSRNGMFFKGLAITVPGKLWKKKIKNHKCSSKLQATGTFIDYLNFALDYQFVVALVSLTCRNVQRGVQRNIHS